LIEPQLVELLNFVDDPQREAGLDLNLFFGQLFLIEPDNFLDRSQTFAKICTSG
jgi:hypothetical protein